MEREPYNRKQGKIAKAFKAVISAGLVAPVFVSLSSCKEAPTVVEEEEQHEEEKPVVESAPATTVTESVPSINKTPPVEKKVEETQTEFNESMIKNRLIVSEEALEGHREYPWQIGGEEVPLWYLGKYTERNFIASGVIAGPFRKDVGATGEEEILVPVAFQNPVSKKFYVRDISYGNDEYFSEADPNRWFFKVIFKDYTYTLVHGVSVQDRHSGGKFEDIESNLKIGDQVAFMFPLETSPELEEYADSGIEPLIIKRDFLNVYIPNNLSIRNAMITDKDLPELKLFPEKTMFSKAKDNNY
jgi:hypothetical protein